VDPEERHNLLVLAKLLGELAHQVANLGDHLTRILKLEKNVSLPYVDQDKIKKWPLKFRDHFFVLTSYVKNFLYHRIDGIFYFIFC
jgi:hypothetical protein